MLDQEMRKQTALVVAMVVLTSVSGCVTSTTDEPEEGTVSTDSGGKHPGMESRLYRLTKAENATEFASTHGIEMRDGSVEVVVELGEGTRLPSEYDVARTLSTNVTRGNRTLIQAYVAVDDLEPLAEHPNVSYIRTPIEATR